MCVAVIVVTLYGPPAQATPNDPKDVAAIQQIVERFGAAFRNKDVDSFPDLFYSANPDEVIWQFVVEDTRLARIQKFKPKARKTRRLPGNNYLTAIQGIAADPLPTEEKFFNVKIDTDGEVGSVNFDYIVLVGGEEKNWGREMWHLVRTDQGWKIISVIFSARDPLPKEQQPSVR
ncbi:nuclear transport factor 2 family protein [Sinimarinibacterium sp. CAU 1509]|nr:nuclear transport factor 2 family protein [Sinimarinibacterium sp. CAU 1509]